MRHDREAERAVLSAMILSREAIDDAGALLTADDFAIPSHALVFTAIKWLHESERAVDATTLRDILEKRGRLEDVGGQSALLDIAGSTPSSRNVAHHARIVFREAVFRRLHAAAQGIASLEGHDETAAVAHAAQLVESSIGPERSEAKTITSLIPAALDRYEHPPDSVKLDEWGVWLDEGDVCIVGARPSVGKTAFMVHEARKLAERHLRCRIYSYEMSEQQIVARLVAVETGIESMQLRKGLDADGIAYVRSKLSAEWANFLSIDDRMPTIDRLVTDMRRFANKGGKVVIIDYLQLIGRQDTETATENSRRLKIAAGQTGLVTVAASQLSRDGKQQDGTFRTPSLADLRQTGAIEQDADVAMMLHRYKAEDATKRDKLKQQGWILEHDDVPGKHLSHVEIAKARNGQGHIGRRYAWFDETCQTWAHLDRTEDGRAF